MNWKFWKKQKSTPTETVNKNYNETKMTEIRQNGTNTCIKVGAGTGGIEVIHVDSPSPETAEQIFNRIYETLSKKQKERKSLAS